MMNNKGFSITELCIAIALGGIVLLAFMDIMQFMRIMDNRGRVKADIQTTRALAERYLWMGLKNAAPSFNNIQVADDTGQDFYDLNRDLATPSGPATGMGRKITLNLTTGQRSFLALLSDVTVARVQAGYPDVIFLDPVKFYNITLNAPPTLGIDWGLFRNFVNTLNPNFLIKNTQVIEVYVPSTMRNAGAPVSTIPNSTSYFIRCANAGACNTETFGGLVSFRNAQNSGIAISDFDNYLKTIPSASGGIPPILARVVKLVRYELRQPPRQYGNNAGDLYYSTWDGGAFSNPVLIADRVVQVVFARPNINDPTITIDVTQQTERQRTGK